MEEKISFISESRQRLDSQIAANVPSLSRSQVQGLIEAGMVSVEGQLREKRYKPQIGQLIELTVPEPETADIEPQNIALDIVYEDPWLLVVNKPKGMVVHPAPGNYSGTMVNALMHHAGSSLSGINGKIRPGIVHRIDKDTTGLLIVAKNDEAHRSLAKQIKEHSFTREYRAVVYGTPNKEEGAINAPLGRNPKNRKQMAVLPLYPGAREAVTHYTVEERFSGFSLLRLRLETGRTHQIRVHMAYIGHPVAGDPVYGPKKAIAKLQGQCLHAGLIGFVHPNSGEYMEFSAPLPEYFNSFISELRAR